MNQKQQLSLLLLFVTFCLNAQKKGVVKDSLTGKPIAYVSIWVENENKSSTTEENGTFTINTTDKKNLIFSAIGYEKKIVKAAANLEVFLKSKNYQLEDVVFLKKPKTKQIEIGKTGNNVSQAFDSGPKIDTKFFPYYTKYSKTDFIKQLIFSTDCKIDEASIKFHFYKKDAAGFPGEEMLDQNLIVTVLKGVNSYTIDLTKFNMYFPKDGLFVGVEKLNIEKNKLERVLFNENTQSTSIQTTFCPMVLYNYMQRPFSFSYSGGNWMKKENTNPEKNSNLIGVFEPSINLILSN